MSSMRGKGAERMNLALLEIELTHSTRPPWESTSTGLILQSSNKKIVAVCSSEFNARLITALRNEIDELIERLNESYNETEYNNMVSDYDEEIEELKSEHTKNINELQRQLRQACKG